MHRRHFLRAAGTTPFALNGFSITPFANSQLAAMLAGCEGVEDRVMILIQLKGGNDGLNTLVPLNQYDAYAKLRPLLKVPDKGVNKYLTLDNAAPANKQTGLHPVLTNFKAMYEQGLLNIVQGVGYENVNQSHFKGTDLWLSGGDSTREKFKLRTGWMGRALQTMYPDVKGAPIPRMKYPLGIQIGDPYPSLGFHTETEHRNSINLYGQDPDGFYSLIQTIGGAPVANVPDSDYGTELAFIMGVEKSVDLYSEHITAAFKAGRNAVSTYPTTGLAWQLRTVARLINGGCKTKIYLCSMGGFDTHGDQILPEGDITFGAHAELLKQFSDALKFFYDDLAGLGLADKVMACTFSEFGRCAKENGASGTDHGTLAPMFVFGKATKPGMTGINVNLANLTPDNQLQGQQYDYRQVFAALLQDWLGGGPNVMQAALFEGYTKAPVVADTYVVAPECYNRTTSVWYQEEQIVPLRLSPNPAITHTEIRFSSDAEYEALLSVHALTGTLVQQSRVEVQSGDNLFYLSTAQMPAGTYFIRLEGRGRIGAVTRLVVSR
jgi:uncharacterized protein (DUF1501 family)